MRRMSLPAFVLFMTMLALMIMIALTLGSCNRPLGLLLPKHADAANNLPVLGSAPAKGVSAPVALPNFTALVKLQGPAVINISTTRKVRGVISALPPLTPDDPLYEFFRHFAPGDQFSQEFRTQSLGSGFIVSPDGYILTNAHVVDGADEITVRLTDQREFKANVVGADKRSDIALLTISAKGLPVVNIGDSSKLEVGEWVVAIGSPFGFSNSVSQGIVSAQGRSLPGENIVPFIQTDVPVNPGNSGGPLFNLKGEVVGINSQIYSRSGGYMGLSFAIPINLAMKVKDELLKHGSVRRGRLGVTIQAVSPDHARSFALDKPRGALITSVEEGGPAARAGIEIGDIILTFNGKELASSDDLVRAVAEAAPGLSAELQVWRKGAATEVTASLGEADTDQVAQKQAPRDTVRDSAQVGLSLRELSGNERRLLHTDGFLLVDAAAGVAAESGIQSGDVIMAINSQRVSSIKQFRAVLAKSDRHAALLVQRDGNMIFVPLKFLDE